MPRRALVVFPESDQLTIVEDLRRRFDPLARLIAAHVTLVFPFTSDLSTDALRHHVERGVRGCPPFQVRLEGISEADDDYVFLDVSVGKSGFVDLHDRLYSGVLAGHLSTEHIYRPHVTVARVADRSERATVLTVARDVTRAVTADVRAVSAFVLHDDGRGEVEFAVPLQVDDR